MSIVDQNDQRVILHEGDCEHWRDRAKEIFGVRGWAVMLLRTHGWTVEEIGEALSIDHSTVTRIEQRNARIIAEFRQP